MIYLVSTQSHISELYESCSVEESLDILIGLPELSVDTETTGLNCHLDRIFLLQLGNEDIQIIVDINTIDIQIYKGLIENKPLILQNAKFDLTFFLTHSIIPTNIYDTMLAEQVLFNGLSPAINLAALAEKYCGVELNKDVRKDISRGIISDRVIIYGADDIKVLPKIKQTQVELAIERGVTKAVSLENKFVPSLAYSEFCGIYLNKDKWIEKFSSAGERLKMVEKRLDEYVISNNHRDFIDKQLDLFSTELRTTINWSSSKQVKEFFKTLGVDVRADNKTGESISEGILVKQENRFEIIPIFLEYQGIKKEFTTYGEKFLQNINPITNRIHSNFSQLMNTGRLSSSRPNMQNLPSDSITRGCFTPQYEENILIDVDYTAQEDILFVNFSKEQKMIDFYQGEFSDGHSYVASLCFPKELEGVEMKDIKKLHPDLRFLAKSAKFAIN